MAGIFLPDVLEEQGSAGGENHQIGQPENQLPVEHTLRQRRAGHQHPQPGKDREGGKLQRRQDKNIPALGVLVHRHNVGREEKAAD